MNTPEISRVTDVDINKEMRDAYLQYSMSVIVGRALPDVRDGLKPVHRRVLFAMNDLNNTHDKPYKKSARVVGDVIGKYHPHGDMAVYDTIVRMAQDFSLRYPLVDGQGNFGSIDGDSPAAPRYTEIRMTELAEELLADIEKDTVPFGPNYDDSLLIPSVLPAKFPNLLINGSSGIAVGMATNIPPHNLGEIIDACMALIENPDITLDELIPMVPGPDFPTAALIVGSAGIHSAYRTGRGVITLKAVAEVVPRKDREDIIVTEIPYQVNKARLIESIADHVKEKRIEGISDIRDESSREGMRIVINLKKNENAQVVLNRLFKFTQMQVSYGIIMLALDARTQPVVFNLKQMLEAFLEHRKDVVTKRCIFDLKKAEARAHILDGLSKALDQIDLIIAAIRASKEAEIARQALINQFHFSERQAQAILEMRLQRLTGLERQKILDELTEVNASIAWLRKVLGDVKEIFKIIVTELTDIRAKYSNPRRTKIEVSEGDMDDEDLIADVPVVVTMTESGYIKRFDSSEYRLQKRGGVGLKGGETKEEDSYIRVFSTTTKTSLLIFSDRGKLYWLKVFRLPIGSRTSRGKAISGVVPLSQGETVRAILPIQEFIPTNYIVMLTEKGVIKKTSLAAFARQWTKGLLALQTDLDDKMKEARISNGSNHILIMTAEGMVIRFDESGVRPMGRGARGVRGIMMGPEDRVVGMELIEKDSKQNILLLTSKGYAKRVSVEDFRIQSRAGAGLMTQKHQDKVGNVVAALIVKDEDQALVTTASGQAIRFNCSEVRQLSRAAAGVRIINLKENDSVSSLALLDNDGTDVLPVEPPLQ